ncbi:MAG: hypothetical protein IJW71_00830 [Clostridia bacterium]|nr:hypothetical protein [Clostridia bacterium]
MKKICLLCVILLLIFAFLPILTLTAATPTEFDGVLTCLGISARVDGESNGLRTLYKIDLQKLSALESAGYSLEIGALLGVGSYGDKTLYSFSDLTLENAVQSQNLTAATVYATNPDASASYTFLTYTEGESAAFALTLQFGDDAKTADAPRERYLASFLYRGFLRAVDPAGNVTVVYADPAESYRGGVSLNDVARTLTEGGEYADSESLLALIARVGHRVTLVCKNPNGGAIETVAILYVPSGECADLSDLPSDLVPDGYSFEAWNYGGKPITADIQIHAILTEKENSWSPPIQ